MTSCNLTIVFGEANRHYAFPEDHPFRIARVDAFMDALRGSGLLGQSEVRLEEPRRVDDEILRLFHTARYLAFVRQASQAGYGYLDYGDTPAFPGVYEAAASVVGATLRGLELVMTRKGHHAFNPVGGLHHAQADRAGGFCVFNDIAIAIHVARRSYNVHTVLYVDIDAHHGDGVAYAFDADPSVVIADIHEDGRYLYPGTGHSHERGSGRAEGTKLNIPLRPGASTAEFLRALQSVEAFIRDTHPELVILQAGADGLQGDPLTHLRYEPPVHRATTQLLHQFAHVRCEGRLLALGGGGYSLANVASAWMEVVRTLVETPHPVNLADSIETLSNNTNQTV